MITIHEHQIRAILAFVLDNGPNCATDKISQIKTFRALTGYGLWESKILIEAERERRAPTADPISKALDLIRDRQVAERAFSANN